MSCLRSAFCILTFAFLISATTAPATVDFADPAGRFSLKLPADWAVPDPIPAEPPGLVFTATAPQSTDSAADGGVLGLRISDAPPGASDAMIARQMSSELAAYTFDHGGKEVRIVNIEVGILAARAFTFKIDPASQPADSKLATPGTQTLVAVAIRRKKAYVFSFAVPARRFNELMPVAEAVLKSFEVSE